MAYNIVRKDGNPYGSGVRTVMFTYAKRSEAKAALKAMSEKIAEENPTRHLFRPDGLMLSVLINGQITTVWIEQA